MPAYDYAYARVDQETHLQRMRTHGEMVAGTAPSPYRYRILVPTALNPFIVALGQVAAPEAAFKRVYAAYYFASLAAMLAILFIYLREWYSEEHSMVGILMVAATLPIVLRQHYYASWSMLEPALLTWGLILIRGRNWAWLIPLTAVASMNRETGVLIPVAAAIVCFYEWPVSTRRFGSVLASLAVWAAVFFGVRRLLGPGDESISIASIFQINISHEGLWSAIGNVGLFAGLAGWVLAGVGYSKTPLFVQRTGWIALCYLPLYLVWGIWYEVRLLMPLYPILVPAMLSGIFQAAPTINSQSRA